MSKEVYYCDENSGFDWEEPFQKLYKLQQSRILCDITLRLMDGEIHAHKAVLAVRAPYFMKLFKSSLTNKDTDISHLPNFTTRTMEFVVQFIYTGKIELSDLDTIMDVFRVGDFFQMYGLIWTCERNIFLFFMEIPENVVKIATFVEYYSEYYTECEESAGLQGFDSFVHFTSSMWSYITEVDDWSDFPIRLLLIILGHEEFNPRNEDNVLDGVLKWLGGNEGIEEDVIIKLVGFINVTLLSPDKVKQLDNYLSNFDNTTTSVPGIGSCEHLLKRHYYGDSFYLFLRKEMLSAREQDDPSSVLYNAPCHMQTYSKDANSWRDMQCDWMEWDYTKVVSTNSKIYLIGGLTTRDYSEDLGAWITNRKLPSEIHVQNICEYDPSTEKRWTTFPDMPALLSDSSAGAVNDTIYICGGERQMQVTDDPDERQPSRALFLLNMETGNWPIATEMSCARFSHSSVTLKDRVYVVGGTDNEGRPAKAEHWDPVANVWSDFPIPNINRMSHNMTATDDRIFVLGGRLTSPLGSWGTDEMQEYLRTYRKYSYESYDPREGIWTAPVDLPIKVLGFVANSLGNEVYVFGGCDQNKSAGTNRMSNQMHILDLRNNMWREGEPSILYNSFSNEERAMWPMGVGVC